MLFCGHYSEDNMKITTNRTRIRKKIKDGFLEI